MENLACPIPDAFATSYLADMYSITSWLFLQVYIIIRYNCMQYQVLFFLQKNYKQH